MTRPAAGTRRDVELLHALPLFASLPADSQDRLIGAAVVRIFSAGSTLFRAGDPSAGLFVILERDATLPVLNRLAAFILERSVAERSSSFSLGMTQGALAEELGTVREMIVRGLGQLRHDAVIVAAGRARYSVRDIEALRRLARG